MTTNKKLGFALFLVIFLFILPTANASAEEGRYFIKSTKNFWKNALNARNVFENGFTADLSDFQVRFAQIWGLEIESVKVLQILPSPSVVKDTKKLSMWGIKTIYSDPTIIRTSGGEDVNVAVLDTGALVTHPDIKDEIKQCKDFTAFKFSVVDGKCEDKNGHGTHVAGIIAANGGADGKGIYGVAPAANLFIYKVCSANGSCFADDVAIAIRTAVDQGANILNLSFGSDAESQLVADAINYAASKKVLTIAAAGNDGPFEASIDFPAAQPEVVAVGAINQDKKVVEWSSRGINEKTKPYVVERQDIEFAAPGENIESSWNNGGYAILSGTSMASPFVAGLAAKYWQKEAKDPAAATREILHEMAVDLSPVGDDNASGFGLPQIVNSSNLADK